MFGCGKFDTIFGDPIAFPLFQVGEGKRERERKKERGKKEKENKDRKNPTLNPSPSLSPPLFPPSQKVIRVISAGGVEPGPEDPEAVRRDEEKERAEVEALVKTMREKMQKGGDLEKNEVCLVLVVVGFILKLISFLFLFSLLNGPPSLSDMERYVKK